MAPKPPKDRRGLRVVGDIDDGVASSDLVEVTLRATLDFRTELKMAAAEDRETMSEYVIKAVRERIAARRRALGK